MPLGGLALDQQGPRSSPSLRYLNANETAVVAKVRTLPYFNELRFAYTLAANASDTQVMNTLLQALTDYQAGDPEYQPFTSKLDAVRAGSASFTAQEQRGLAAFNDPRRGNWASCHSSAPRGPQPALFTNFEYFALGAPRNVSVATNNPSFFDLGLCGPNRSDLAARTDLCGLFKVPTLRNVALSAPYFHNGVFNTLEQVVNFYATRDTDPTRWYPVVDGQLQLFNDLPAAYRANVTQQAPFGRRAGQVGALNAQEVADIVAFLNTLTDGFSAAPR